MADRVYQRMFEYFGIQNEDEREELSHQEALNLVLLISTKPPEKKSQSPWLYWLWLSFLLLKIVFKIFVLLSVCIAFEI